MKFAKRSAQYLFFALGVLSLCGCSSTETQPREKHRYPTAQEAANVLGCTEDEVAMCIEINCELDEYRCADSDDVRKMFKAGEYRHQ